MGIYGHKFDSLLLENSYQYEQTILMEMNISKNDLKDPKILDKVLDRARKEENIATSVSITCPMLLSISADIIAGIISGSIITSLALFIPFIIGGLALAVKILDSLPNYEKKNVSKLVKKAEDLKKKTMRLKDSKEKQEIIKNCDNVLKAVKQYEQKKIDEALKIEHERKRGILNIVIKIAKGQPAQLPELPRDFFEYYEVADKLGIMSPGKMDKAIANICANDLDDRGILNLVYGVSSIYDKNGPDRKEVEDFEKVVPGFKDNIKVCYLYAIDDTVFFYNPKNKTFVYGDYFPDTLDVSSSLYQLAKEDNDEGPLSKEDLEEYKSIYEEIKNK